MEILSFPNRKNTRLVFVSSVAQPTTVWNRILSRICKNNEILGKPEYSDNEFKIYVKAIKDVESAMDLCKEMPNFETANFYVNGIRFKFKYLRQPTDIEIESVVYKTVGEFTIPNDVDFNAILNGADIRIR